MDKKFTTFVSLCCLQIISAQPDSLDRAKKNDSIFSAQLPMFVTGNQNGETLPDQQDVSSLLQASRDVFTQFAGFQFSPAGFRMRGYSADQVAVMINGVNMNDPASGYSTWSSWGGLNDVTRFTETRSGIGPCRYGFQGAGGYTSIDSRASSFKKNTRFTFSTGNRVYRQRYSLTHSTGQSAQGWSFALAASMRSGNEVYIPGTWFRAGSFYLAIEKRISHKHSIGFTGFFAPLEQGLTKAVTAEVYRLAGTNYYNPSWGVQNGKRRNASVQSYARPVFILSHTYKPKKDQQVVTGVCYTSGRSGKTGLTWYKAPNPLPDYYRNLPSYYYLSGDTLRGDRQAGLWPDNQLNWDRLISMNQANLYAPPSQNGLISTDSRARYIIENQVEAIKNLIITSTLNQRVGRYFISGGINANRYSSRRFKEVEDLLGADFWIDLDQFAEQLGVEEFYQLNDIDNPNKKIYEGDKFGYDYSIHITKGEAWSQAEYNGSKVDLYAGASLSCSNIWREGYVANGKFPENSKGQGEKVFFINKGVKTGATMRLTGRHYITINGLYLTRPPAANNLFISPSVRQGTIDGIANEQIWSADASYIIRYPSFRLRLSIYNTISRNMTTVQKYWHDEFSTMVNMVMKNVNGENRGVELGLERNYRAHTFQGAISAGSFVYTNRPVLEAWQDNNAAALFTGRVAYLKNMKLPGPQLACGAGYRYNGKRHWWAGINLNYFGQIYLAPNPDRRTAEATEKFLESERSIADEITRQEMLPSFNTVNFSAGKNIRIRRSQLNVNLLINNLLNQTSIITSGYESLRWDRTEIKKFPPKYSYMTGLNWMLTMSLNF